MLKQHLCLAESLALKLSFIDQGKHAEKVSVFQDDPFFRLKLVITWPLRQHLSVPGQTGSSSRVDKISLSRSSAKGIHLLSLFWIHLSPTGVGKRRATFSVPLSVSPAPLLSFLAQRHRQHLHCQWKWTRIPAPSSPPKLLRGSKQVQCVKAVRDVESSKNNYYQQHYEVTVSYSNWFTGWLACVIQEIRWCGPCSLVFTVCISLVYFYYYYWSNWE